MGLAELLESDSRIRENMRMNGQCTAWSKPSLIGQPYVKNMLLNTRLLEIVGHYWCNEKDEPTILPIPLLRAEAMVIKMTLCFTVVWVFG